MNVHRHAVSAAVSRITNWGARILVKCNPSKTQSCYLCNKQVLFIVDSDITRNLPLLSHRRTVANISLFYTYYQRFCSSIINQLVKSARETRLTVLSSLSRFAYLHRADLILRLYVQTEFCCIRCFPRSAQSADLQVQIKQTFFFFLEMVRCTLYLRAFYL